MAVVPLACAIRKVCSLVLCAHNRTSCFLPSTAGSGVGLVLGFFEAYWCCSPNDMTSLWTECTHAIPRSSGSAAYQTELSSAACVDFTVESPMASSSACQMMLVHAGC
ncbi:hypothetical protein WJX77_001438 [Trebouxia sp. C0004]